MENVTHLQNLTEQMQQEMTARIDSLDMEFRRRLAELSTNQTQRQSQSGYRTRSPESGFLGNGPTFNRQHRSFAENEKLMGNRNFREWSSTVMTEFQVLGILETIASEFTVEILWPQNLRMRADALARSILTQSVDDFIEPQIRDLLSAFQMWTLLVNRYQTISSFEPHKLVTQIERLTFAEVGSAIALIEQGIMIRDKYKTVSNKLSEFYWSSAILRKPLPIDTFLKLRPALLGDMNLADHL